MRSKAFSLVIPLYNEAKNIKELVNYLVDTFRQEGINYELVLVDNGSYDSTGELISRYTSENPRIRKCYVQKNQGYGWGIIKGLEVAKGDYLGFMCGDGQILPEDVVRVLKKISEENLDLCKVKRIYREDGMQRRVISSIYNMLFKIIFKTKVNDINGTPKIFTRELYNKIRLVSKDWFIDAEIILKCSNLQCNVGELPVRFHKRKTGGSNVGVKAIVEFIKNILIYLIKKQRFSKNDV